MTNLKREAESKYLQNIRGFKQHYLDWQGSRTPIILLHPKRSNSRHWDHMVDLLSATNRVLAPDFRGHGLSEYPESGYTVPGLGEDIISFINSLKIDKAIFVGCATGGNLCIWLAANYSDKVKEIAKEVLRQTYEEHNFPNYESAKSSMYFQEFWSKDIKNHYAKYSFKKRSDGRWEWLYSPKAAINISESLDKDSVWNLSKLVKCPAFILRGVDSPVFTQEHIDRLAQYISHADKINLENASHTPAQENPSGLAYEIDKLARKF